MDLRIFLGEPEDVPDSPFGFLLLNRRQWAKERCQFIGYVLPSDPAQYQDRTVVSASLGYGDQPVVICSIGGTGVGRDLLTLCGRAFPLLRAEMPSLHVVLVTGPRLAPEAVSVPEGVEIHGFMLVLHEHFAACGLAVVQGGGTPTLELTALRKPVVFFPVEGHCEQNIHVAGRVTRHGVGIRKILSRTSPDDLASTIRANLGATLSAPPTPFDGAHRAASLLVELLERKV